ncbi:unnamed protein product (macronuclear) [Paramecium tetraurelia]|uniref:Uncharacterized protein n=1 Tax=Paramecium tetraurelia TaxID=5888 RepID=A0C7N6_PARTE|nr:uncharacterized protein GSPATT00035933001 [Paramecium tetraurelia]CAK66803.1 unnamed protein product [Paramecium tetraurelia]|eukprot:XP_001434200.1 hypothetical protein (macronuclear) [Paramecium tetraurelia strain d4-2]
MLSLYWLGSFIFFVILIAIARFIYYRIQDQGMQRFHNEQTNEINPDIESEVKRKEQERLEEEKKKQERLEEERKKQERLEAEKKKQEKLEEERKEQERLEAEKKKQEKLEEERKEQERLEEEKKKQEKLEEERKKQERLEEKKKQERLEAEKKKQEKLEEERKKQERLEEKKKQERLEEQRKEQERLEEKKKQERLRIKEESQKQLMQQELQPISYQFKIQQEISTKPVQQQIQILNSEIKKIDNNNNLSNNKKQYYKHQYQQQLVQKLKDQGDAKSIPHVRQNIDSSNPEVALFVLKESLLRDQNRELLTTSQEYSFGFDSIIGSYGSEQSCLKVRNKKFDYDKIMNDNQILQQHLLDFQQKLSSSLNISIDQIEILGVSKGSFEISFNITGIDKDQILKEINDNKNAKKFLNEYCNGKVEYLQYFDSAKNSAKGVTLSSDDFSPKYNRNWDGFHEKEQRGPSYHRYDYYFPRGCYGFGLNIKKYGNDDWVKINGNINEWRILYHGTNQVAVNPIVRDNLTAGGGQFYKDDECINEFGKKVKVGKGIYFSDKISVSKEYSPPIQTGNKRFSIYFMSRVNPKKIRQSDRMKQKNYFVVNSSEDVRSYRILIQEDL